MNCKRIYGLVGYPLCHSFSKKFFTYKFIAENINAEYVNFELPDIHLLKDRVLSMPQLSGFNVTIPYKKAIIPFLDDVDDVARRIGAVNTVRVEGKKNGKYVLKGYNSDIIGFRESLAPMLKPGMHKALVLGTGGASLAVCEGLHQLGIEYKLVSRSGREDILSYDDLTPDIIENYTIIVNTTPLGMFPNVNTAPNIPYESIGHQYICFDLVYNPEMTEFLRRTSRRGAMIKNGLEMLHLQALESWRIWH